MISLEKPINFIFVQIIFLFFMWYFIHDRTELAVINKFSKSNIKKKKRGIMNRLFFYRFHKERSLGIWYYLNIVCFAIVFFNVFISVIVYMNGYINIICFILFSMSYLFTAIASLVAEIKTTKVGFKMKHATERQTNVSIVTGSIIIIISSIAWVFYLYYIYAAKINLNG